MTPEQLRRVRDAVVLLLETVDIGDEKTLLPLRKLDFEHPADTFILASVFEMLSADVMRALTNAQRDALRELEGKP